MNDLLLVELLIRLADVYVTVKHKECPILQINKLTLKSKCQFIEF